MYSQIIILKLIIFVRFVVNLSRVGRKSGSFEANETFDRLLVSLMSELSPDWAKMEQIYDFSDNNLVNSSSVRKYVLK